MSRWAVFMDRDGTVNQDVGHLGDPDRLRLLPKAAEAIKMLNGAGAKVIVVSNQSGVARGLFSEQAVSRVNRRLLEELSTQGAMVDAFYFCPHHPEIGDSPYRTDCACRKPRPGLLLQAAREHDIDLSRSYMAGDELSDVEAGASAGCRTVLVLSGKEKDTVRSRGQARDWPSFVARDIYEAAQWIIGHSPSTRRKTG